MDKNEEYVRGVCADREFERVFEQHRRGLCCGYPDCDGDLPGEEHENCCPAYLAEEKYWSAAAEFTRERLEQVRQLRRQISLMKEGLTDWAVEILLSGVSVEMSADLMNAEYVRDECTGYFVLALLEAELARLTVGMKKEVEG